MALPSPYRRIAYSIRGYGASTPYTPDEKARKVASSTLGAQHGTDCACFLKFIVNELSVPGKSAGGGLSLVGWSQGCLMLLLLAKHGEISHLVQSHLRGVVFWEPSRSAVLGLPAGEAQQVNVFAKMAAQQDWTKVVLPYIMAYFPHSADYLANKGGPQALHPTSTLYDNPDFMAESESSRELGLGLAIAQHHIGDTPAEKVAEVEQAIIKLSTLCECIGILYSDHGTPDCLEGCWHVEQIATQAGAHVKLAIVHGGNHFAQAVIPKV